MTSPQDAYEYGIRSNGNDGKDNTISKITKEDIEIQEEEKTSHWEQQNNYSTFGQQFGPQHLQS